MTTGKADSDSGIFIAVPSYNHAQFVEKCLRSIISQTRRPEKLVVIDDGSSDGSPQVIERVLKECPFKAELIVRENRGLCRTLNEAFSFADQKYFAYLGSDDIWLPEFLERRIDLLDARPEAVLAFGHAFLIDGDDDVIDTTKDWSDFGNGNVLPLLLEGTIFSSPSVVYRRDALARFSWNEESRLEDYEMYLKLSTLGPFAFDPSELCAWRQHGDNASDDVVLMQQEWQDAQNRTAELLGIGKEKLEIIQRRMRFIGIANLARHGFRREASAALIADRKGASSIGELIKTALRVFVPTTAYNVARKRRFDRNRRKFDRISVGNE
jgi:Glycosyltransferases involved in cell wall biogenesis